MDCDDTDQADPNQASDSVDVLSQNQHFRQPNQQPQQTQQQLVQERQPEHQSQIQKQQQQQQHHQRPSSPPGDASNTNKDCDRGLISPYKRLRLNDPDTPLTFASSSSSSNATPTTHANVTSVSTPASMSDRDDQSLTPSSRGEGEGEEGREGEAHSLLRSGDDGCRENSSSANEGSVLIFLSEMESSSVSDSNASHSGFTTKNSNHNNVNNAHEDGDSDERKMKTTSPDFARLAENQSLEGSIEVFDEIVFTGNGNTSTIGTGNENKNQRVMTGSTKLGREQIASKTSSQSDFVSSSPEDDSAIARNPYSHHGNAACKISKENVGKHDVVVVNNERDECDCAHGNIESLSSPEERRFPGPPSLDMNNSNTSPVFGVATFSGSARTSVVAHPYANISLPRSYPLSHAHTLPLSLPRPTSGPSTAQDSLLLASYHPDFQTLECREISYPTSAMTSIVDEEDLHDLDHQDNNIKTVVSEIHCLVCIILR